MPSRSLLPLQSLATVLSRPFSRTVPWPVPEKEFSQALTIRQREVYAALRSHQMEPSSFWGPALRNTNQCDYRNSPPVITKIGVLFAWLGTNSDGKYPRGTGNDGQCLSLENTKLYVASLTSYVFFPLICDARC